MNLKNLFYLFFGSLALLCFTLLMSVEAVRTFVAGTSFVVLFLTLFTIVVGTCPDPSSEEFKNLYPFITYND